MDKQQATAPINVMEVLSPQLAQAALEFISRANLIGKEVAIFTDVVNALSEVAQGTTLVVGASLPAEHTKVALELCEVQAHSKLLEEQVQASARREKDLTMQLARAQSVVERVVAALDSPAIRKQRLINLARELRGDPVESTVAK